MMTMNDDIPIARGDAFERIKNYHKALSKLLHSGYLELDDDTFSEGSADRCDVEDAWETLNTNGEK